MQGSPLWCSQPQYVTIISHPFPFSPHPPFPPFLIHPPQPTVPHFPRFSPLHTASPLLHTAAQNCEEDVFSQGKWGFFQLFKWDIAGKTWIDSYTSITYSALKYRSEMCFRKTSWELQFEDQGCIRLQRPGGIVVNTRVTNQLNMFPFQYFFSYCLLNFESSGICFVWKSAGSPDKSRSCPKVLR